MTESISTAEGETDDYPVGVGEVVDGRFRVERYIGIGAMGLVVEAMHLELGERVALKFLKRSAAKNEDAVVRFAREARAAARLKSKHVARVHDVGDLPDGTPYIVLEYLEGTNLDDRLMRHGRYDNIDAAVLCILQVCEAVAEAHALGIIHRDIKPANVFLMREMSGAPLLKLLDFGISKAALTGEYTNIELASTKTSTIMGSPYYMAPEQVKSTRDVDARADIWALGAVLFELLTGKPVWRSDELAKLVNEIMAQEPLKIRALRSDIDERFEVALCGALTKDPDARYQTVAAFAEALAPFAPPELAAAHLEQIRSLTQRGPTKAIPSLRTSSRNLNARPERITHSSLPAAAPNTSLQLAVGIGSLACLGIATAIFVPRLFGGAPTTSTTPAAAASSIHAPIASAPEPPPSTPPLTASTAAPARPAAEPAPSTPTRKPAFPHAPVAVVPAAPHPPVAAATATPARSVAKPTSAEPAEPKKPDNALDSDPYRKNQPKLEDNPFK